MIIGELDPKRRQELMREVRAILPRTPAGKRKKVLQLLEGSPLAGISISGFNTKLGQITNFSLPAGQWFREATCPGASELCEKICYALKGRVQLKEYLYWMNWAYLRLWPDDFAKNIVRAQLAPVTRVHVGGDFVTPAYVRLWSTIATQREDVRFFAYTRSWQNGEGRVAKRFIEPLREFSELPNVRLVLSIDDETGVPPVDLVPASIRAWLARDDDDVPPEPVELVFRHRRGKYEKKKFKGTTLSSLPPDAQSPEEGSTVCPYERLRPPTRKKGDKTAVLKEGAITCQNCAWCWGGAHEAYGRRDDDLSRFSMWAGTDLVKRTAQMFRPFASAGSPTMGAAGDGTDDCICGAIIPCPGCAVCVVCMCRCPR